MITAKDILEDMYRQAKGICDMTYVSERPASTSDKMNSFIVCSLPGSLYNNEMSDDGRFDDFSCTVQFEVYVRDKTSSFNLNQPDMAKIDKVTRQLLSMFPMTGTHCTFYSPTQEMAVSDGKHFHCVIMQSKMRTR